MNAMTPKLVRVVGMAMLAVLVTSTAIAGPLNLADPTPRQIRVEVDQELHDYAAIGGARRGFLQRGRRHCAALVQRLRRHDRRRDRRGHLGARERHPRHGRSITGETLAQDMDTFQVLATR